MKVLDTLTREPRAVIGEGNLVRMYVCGVTPYDTTHLGHARTFLVYDVLVRHLRARGVAVRYVRNVTDVDDSILERARQMGEHYLDLAERYMRIFDQDMRALNAIPPDVAPRATQEIPEMQRLIRAILDKGQAYVRQGTVYFRVASVPQYGSLSRFDRARMLAVNREFSENPDDPLKEDPLDFPIWKAAVPGEPTWDSPWGPGRPGWHIECSAMSERYLGVEFDLHGGGEDLIFPHHENELAQSAGFSGRYPFAHVWMHVGMVRLGGIKMSKSLGNMVFARDLLRRYTSDAIRLYLLRQPYREPLDYDEAELAACEARVQQLRAATEGANSRAARPDSRAETGREAALAALDDNLDTPRALAVLEQLAAQAREDRERADPSPVLAATIRELGERLGLMLR